MQNKTVMITRGAVIASLYVVVVMIFRPISFGAAGAVQCRVAEALTLLPFIWPEAIPGLFVGCLIANILGGLGPWDVFLGSGATLAAAVLTWRCAKSGNIVMAATWPVIVNGVVVGGYLSIIAAIPWFLSMLYVAAGQAIACYALGIPLLRLLSRLYQPGSSSPNIKNG